MTELGILDFVLTAVSFGLQVAVSILLFVLIAWRHESMRALFVCEARATDDMGAMAIVNSQFGRNQLKRSQARGVLLSASASLAMAWASHRFFSRSAGVGGRDWLFWGAVVGSAVQLFLTASSPFIYGPGMLFYQTIWTLAKILDGWSEKVEKLCVEVDGREGERRKGVDAEKFQLDASVAKLTNACLRICRMAENFNENYSFIMTVLYGYFLVVGSLYSYGAFSPLVTPSNFFRAVYWLINFLLVLVHLEAVVKFSHVGQELIDARLRARRALEDAVRLNFDRLSIPAKGDAAILLKRLEDCVKISPFNCFELSHGNLLGMGATCITYMIVLLQFRA